jgi:hypothetical protein
MVFSVSAALAGATRREAIRVRHNRAEIALEILLFIDEILLFIFRKIAGEVSLT